MSVSSNQVYFEGVEKLLEIWFTCEDPEDTKEDTTGKVGGCSSEPDLRKIPREQLVSLLKIVRCEIISYMKNDEIDAFVLSESSMFVSKNRFILKTCGTTTPLLCLEALLMLADEYGGFTEVEHLFYSRKNYKRPELQVSPHQHFEEEVELLDSIFDGIGVACCLGSPDKDCWYLYTLSRYPKSIKRTRGADQTLEILMTDLDPKVMSIFNKSESRSVAEATKRSGIDKIIPSMMIDAFLFEPCGYSMNGITKNTNTKMTDGCYMTIHITPEPGWSYVSFETNYPCSSYRDLITKVVKTFSPGKFTVTTFTNNDSPSKETAKDLPYMRSIGEWMCKDVQRCELKAYDVTYSFYSKFPS